MADRAKPVACGYESGSGGRVSVPVLSYSVATLSCSSIFSERLVSRVNGVGEEEGSFADRCAWDL